MGSKMVFVALLALISVTLAAEKYTTKYDNINVDMILANNRVLNNYIKCLMDEGPCTPEGRELKATLPNALSTGCGGCSDRQRQTSEKVIRHLMTKRSRDWERLSRKYDPKGEYKKRYDTGRSGRK